MIESLSGSLPDMGSTGRAFMKKRKRLIGACIVILLLGGHVRAQNSTIMAYGFTAPVLGLPGETVSVCAFDWVTAPIVAGPVTVTEQVIDVTLGAAVAQQTITLPISPIAQNQPTACVKHEIPATATSPAGPGELVAGAVILYPVSTNSETAPPALFSASVNVSGASVQTIPIPVQTVGSSSDPPIRPRHGLLNPGLQQ
jgi:hypothetical protein